uniref:Uncharacterized protein n=1 Tax=Romanomermis culicivorax TaxID=13658 RepID=A0A915LC72_ROMCU
MVKHSYYGLVTQSTSAVAQIASLLTCPSPKGSEVDASKLFLLLVCIVAHLSYAFLCRPNVLYRKFVASSCPKLFSNLRRRKLCGPSNSSAINRSRRPKVRRTSASRSLWRASASRGLLLCGMAKGNGLAAVIGRPGESRINIDLNGTVDLRRLSDTSSFGDYSLIKLRALHFFGNYTDYVGSYFMIAKVIPGKTTTSHLITDQSVAKIQGNNNRRLGVSVILVKLRWLQRLAQFAGASDGFNNIPYNKNIQPIL